MKCKCGFKFAGAGEFRRCEAFITTKGESGVICPKCNKKYVNGVEVKLEPRTKRRNREYGIHTKARRAGNGA